MKTRHRKRVRMFLRRHAILIVLLGVLFGTVAALTSWYTTTAQQNITNETAHTETLQKEAKELRAMFLTKKAAEERVAQEAAAKKAAEEAKTATEAPAPAQSKACNTSSVHNNPTSIDVVVNKKHCMRPLNYVPADLITVNGATLSAQASGAFKQMYDAAAAAGQPFHVTSSYRSYANQISTYNYWVAQSGQAGTDTYSARAGYSEHQTGYVIDVAVNNCTLDCFGSTSQYQWFQQNAANYGFIQRYYAGFEAVTGYKAEEWHYRYVGTAVAKDMQVRGIKTLEQYWNVSGGDYF